MDLVQCLITIFDTLTPAISVPVFQFLTPVFLSFDSLTKPKINFVLAFIIN